MTHYWPLLVTRIQIVQQHLYLPMGTKLSSTITWGTPLGCLLENLKSLKLMSYLRPSKLIHICNKVWVQYPLDKSSKGPANGTLDLIILRDLHAYCQQSGKWKEVSYIQVFINLHFCPSMCSSCSPTQPLLAMKPRQPPLDDTTTLFPANKMTPSSADLLQYHLKTKLPP